MAGTDDSLREFRQKAQHRQTRLFFQHRGQQSVHPCRAVVQQDACDVTGSAEVYEPVQLCGQRQALTLLMATMVTPKLLLLDEHTAALDPGTAEKVLEITKNVVSERKITCLMVTHNMSQALSLGNRTLMMDSGHIVLDVSGEERAHMTVEDLLEKFSVSAGKTLDNDRILTAMD